MITISNINLKSDISLASIFAVMTKAEMLSICKKLDLYVSSIPKELRFIEAFGISLPDDE